MKNVVLLGSTGSIGTSTIKVAEHLPEAVSINDPAKALELENMLGSTTRICSGEAGLIELATLPSADIVLIAIVGTAGLQPALAAVRAGKDIAVASKEILVMAGETVMNEARKYGVRVLAVDRALKHPSWVMGRKITIDSATLFNKGLEMIEARWLFDIDIARVQVVVHPQSVVHSMVEFIDGSILAQLSAPDMCLPIQYALTYPERVASDRVQTDFARLGSLTFEEPDLERFPSLNLARRAGEVGGTMPAVLNAANEVAVEAFCNSRIGFEEISQTVARVMKRHQPVEHPSLDEILCADAWARGEAAR